MVQADPGSRVVGEYRKWLEPELARLSRQVRTDVGYHRTTEALGIRALETDRLLNEIEDTKSQNRLTVIGILVGSFIGIGQILPGNLDFWWRLGISVGGGIVLSLAYWLWSIRDTPPG